MHMIRAISSKSGLSWKSGRPNVGFLHTGLLKNPGLATKAPGPKGARRGLRLASDFVRPGAFVSLWQELEAFDSLGKGPSQTLLVPLFLNSEGVILQCFLNTALKADLELNPTSSAMAMTV